MTKLLTKARSNLLWIFIVIQVLTLVCIFFEININNNIVLYLLNNFCVILINKNIITSPPIIDNKKLILYKKKTP